MPKYLQNYSQGIGELPKLRWYIFTLVISFILSINSFAQSSVTGKISMSNGEGLPGASVVVEGTSSGTTSDENGNYSLTLPNGASNLIFSFIGYVNQTIPVNGKSIINVTLTEDDSQLEEVVVVGYGTQRKSDLTGSVSSVTAEELTASPVTSMEQGLQGRVAGVNITSNSGAPGGGISVKIRGTTSILNGNEPLYVIDGFPITGQSQFSTNAGRGYDSSTGSDYTVNQNPLSSLNPSDIESIEVLKDASAAAIYGVRGANGVILITTKRGKSGKASISYNGYTGTQSLSDKIEMMGAADYQKIYNDAAANSPTPDPVVFTNAPENDIDWQNMIFRKALIQNHQLSVSGGSDKTRYNVSGSYFNQNGIIKGSDFF